MKTCMAVLLLGTLAARGGELVLEAVDYKDGEVPLQGWVAYDKAWEGKRPVVLIIHEWKGVGEYVKGRARQIAQQGYIGFAIDLYGKGVYAKDHEEAAKLSGALRQDRERMLGRGRAGLAAALALPRADPQRVAAMGYCFGGQTVLEMARAGFDLRMVASFHGNLKTSQPAEKGQVKARFVAAFHGADDRFVGDVEVFKKEWAGAGVPLRFHSYEGAVHSFTVKEAGSEPKTGMAYQEQADLDSWAHLLKYLEEAFKPAP